MVEFGRLNAKVSRYLCQLRAKQNTDPFMDAGSDDRKPSLGIEGEGRVASQ